MMMKVKNKKQKKGKKRNNHKPDDINGKIK